MFLGIQEVSKLPSFDRYANGIIDLKKPTPPQNLARRFSSSRPDLGRVDSSQTDAVVFLHVFKVVIFFGHEGNLILLESCQESNEKAHTFSLFWVFFKVPPPTINKILWNQSLIEVEEWDMRFFALPSGRVFESRLCSRLKIASKAGAESASAFESRDPK